MFPLLQIGPFAVRVPGFFLIVGLMAGVTLTESEAKRQGADPNPLNNLVFFSILAGLVGARLAYVVRYLDTFLANPITIFFINPNTLDMRAGILIALITAVAYGMWKKLSLRPTLDLFTPTFALFAIGLGLSTLASGNAYGSPTDLPWAIYLWDANRHPSQIYYTLWATFAFTVWLTMRKGDYFAGFRFLVWLTLTAAGALFIGAFRGDSVLLAGGVRQEQLVALAVMLFGLWLMRQWGRVKQDADTDEDVNAEAVAA